MRRGSGGAAVRWARRARPAGALRGMRWFPPSATVDPARFQEPGEPFPDHWRHPPAPWPAATTRSSRLREALGRLPALWQAVILAHDGKHRGSDEVARQLGLTLAQERSVLAQARAAVREWLARDAERRP